MGRTVVSPRRAQIALLRIGDDQTIQEAVQQYRGYDSRYAFAGLPKAMEWSAQPKLVSYLAEDLYLDEDPNGVVKSKPGEGPLESTVVVAPRSIYSGVIALRLIKRSSAFTAEVHNWADFMLELRGSDPGKFRNMMKTWWESNRLHFESEKYFNVEPLNNSVVAKEPEEAIDKKADEE